MLNVLHTPLPAVCLVGFFLAGCTAPPAIQIETVIHPDGSCDRMIWQPRDKFLPEAALKPEWNARWKSVSDAPGRPRVSDAKASEDGIKYFIARGSFASPSQIPAHYRYTDPEVPDAGASELERTYERKDYAFVVEHRWKERITNIVTLRGFIRGRDELLDVYLPVYTDAIEKIFSKDYDVARLVAWLRSDGRRFLENASLIVYDAAVRGRVLGKNNQFDGDLINGLYEEAERLGLDFKLLGEMFKLPADQERNERAAKVFVSRLVVRFFRHRDGSAVSAAEADELVRAMADGHRYADEFREESKRIEKSFEGNKEVAQRVRRAATRMVGVYSPIGFGAPEFEFALSLPGEVIETNGTRMKASRVRWKFFGSELFPGGYEMSARSIAIDREGQRTVLGRVVIDDETKALEFMDLVGTEGALLKAVRKLRETGDRDALTRNKDLSYPDDLRARKLEDLLFKG